MDDETDGWMDGWKASFRSHRPLIYVILVSIVNIGKQIPFKVGFFRDCYVFSKIYYKGFIVKLQGLSV
jgi:hypothetical protein